MSQANAARSRVKAALWLLGLIALLAIVLVPAGMRQLLAEAAGRVTVVSVLATLPAQAAATALCAGALWVLRPGPGYWGCLGSRLLRDASGNMPVSLPGLGEVIGARALVLAGGRTRAAISAIALDKLAETVAQIPFILLAAVVLWREWRAPVRLPEGSVLVAAAASAVLLGAGWLLWRRLAARSRLALRIAEEWRQLADAARGQRSGLPLSLGLHGAAWLAGGVQVWMAGNALGYELTLFQAIAIESAAYAGRAIFFFIPAGLVSQEAGLVAAGLVFGLSPAQALALGLVLRLRDLVLGLPLLAWPIYELRHARRAGKA